jgi:hypothetical protein
MVARPILCPDGVDLAVICVFPSRGPRSNTPVNAAHPRRSGQPFRPRVQHAFCARKPPPQIQCPTTDR